MGKLKTGLSCGPPEPDVEFPTLALAELSVERLEPPNPEYLKVHASFCKVLSFCTV
jgi:hypothetical protein